MPGTSMRGAPAEPALPDLEHEFQRYSQAVHRSQSLLHHLHNLLQPYKVTPDGGGLAMQALPVRQQAPRSVMVVLHCYSAIMCMCDIHPKPYSLGRKP